MDIFTTQSNLGTVLLAYSSSWHLAVSLAWIENLLTCRSAYPYARGWRISHAGDSDPLIEHFSAEADDQILRADPIRIIEAIITGVSFFCAATILRPVLLTPLQD